MSKLKRRVHKDTFISLNLYKYISLSLLQFSRKKEKKLWKNFNLKDKQNWNTPSIIGRVGVLCLTTHTVYTKNILDMPHIYVYIFIFVSISIPIQKRSEIRRLWRLDKNDI